MVGFTHANQAHQAIVFRISGMWQLCVDAFVTESLFLSSSPVSWPQQGW